jgi:predicted peptidase
LRDAFVDEVVRGNRVDLARIYVTGHSIGAAARFTSLVGSRIASPGSRR